MSQRSTVLVIDDAPATLGLLDEFLENAGYIVLMAQSGDAAFTVLEHSRPDIVLVDAVMPGMSGLDVCRRLKSATELTDIPVIFMTGLTETQHVVRAFEAGAIDYVTKPLRLEEVLVRLQVHLTTARRAAAARIALDEAGRYLFALDSAGKILWATPSATSLLENQPAKLGEALATQTRASPGETLDAPEDSNLTFVFVGLLSTDERLLRVIPQAPRPEIVLRTKLGLTLRESEVLLWISYGKQTRDIAEILSMGPRTVDKHLEQIYNKLGVGNRASAAAIASRLLGAA
jgi:DNA-binding response OmpR family regulator